MAGFAILLHFVLCDFYIEPLYDIGFLSSSVNFVQRKVMDEKIRFKQEQEEFQV